MNLKEKNQTGDALNESTHAYHTEDGKLQVHRTPAWDTASDIWRTEELAVKVIRSDEEPFALRANKISKHKHIQPTKLGQQLLHILKIDVNAVAKHYPMHVLNPYVDLFFKQAAQRDLFALAGNMRVLNDEECVVRFNALNEFVAELRQVGRSADFKKTVGDFERSSNKNRSEICKFLDAHFELHSRLLVLRIDLGYQKSKDWPNNPEDDVSYDDVKAHRVALLRHLKKDLPPDSFVSYALKLEFGLDKRWHYHLLVLLDGSVVREDVTIAKLIGEHWKKTVTNGKGLYFNCNGIKESYKSCGIGMVSHGDSAAREGLKKAALYMTKTDYYVSLQVPGKDRIFWKGNMPKPKTSSVGRPRARVSDQPVAISVGA